MPYDYSNDAIIRLRNAMKELKENRVSAAYVVSAIDKWAKDHRNGATISESTYNNYRNPAMFRNGPQAALIYDFLEQSDLYQTSHINEHGIDISTKSGSLVQRALRFFSTNGNGFPYGCLKSLEGKYVMYRKSWLEQSDGYFIQSQLQISKRKGVYIFEESQKYSFRGRDVREDDWGFILPYSANFFALTNSEQCMKFYAIHDFYPEPNLKGEVQTFEGNMIALSGRGPHPSFKFYCVRKSSGIVDLGIFHSDDIKENVQLFDIMGKIM